MRISFLSFAAELCKILQIVAINAKCQFALNFPLLQILSYRVDCITNVNYLTHFWASICDRIEADAPFREIRDTVTKENVIDALWKPKTPTQ